MPALLFTGNLFLHDMNIIGVPICKVQEMGLVFTGWVYEFPYVQMGMYIKP